MSAGLVPMRAVRKKSAQAPSFWGLLAVFGVPGLVDILPGSLCSSSHGTVLVGLC